MAVDYFFKFEGIKGEAQDKDHKDEIDVTSWGWGASQSGTAGSGGGAGAGKVNVHDMHFTKFVDLSTPAIIEALHKGTHIAKATLTCRKAGDKPLDYLVIELKEVLFTSWTTGGTHGDDRQTENISINFAEHKTKYTEQKKDGSKGAAPEFAWSVAENAKVG